MGLALISFTGGCANKASTSAPKIDAQKKVINTYFEGLRDGDKKKVLDSLNYSLAQRYVGAPKELDKIFASQKTMGSIKKWSFQEDTISLDELNNQTLVNVKLTYPMIEMDLKFDLRRAQGQWQIFGIETLKKAATGNNYHGAGKTSSKDTGKTSNK